MGVLWRIGKDVYMTKRKKIYLNFILCFLVCMTLYIFSTYFKEYTLCILKYDVRYWILEIIILVLISLLNGIVFDNINKKIYKQPELIFEMMKYLLLQLYSFSTILFYILLVSYGLGREQTYFTEQVFSINLIIFVLYVIYIMAKRKKREKKNTIGDVMKIFIGASIIFQSSLVELLFLGVYLFLLVVSLKLNFLNRRRLKIVIILGSIIVVGGEIGALMSSMNLASKIAVSITNIFIIYLGKQDYTYLVRGMI